MYMSPPFLTPPFPPSPPPLNPPNTLEMSPKDAADEAPFSTATAQLHETLRDSETMQDSETMEAIVRIVRRLGPEAFLSQDGAAVKQFMTKTLSASVIPSADYSGPSPLNEQAMATLMSLVFRKDGALSNQCQNQLSEVHETAINPPVTQPDSILEETMTTISLQPSKEFTFPVVYSSTPPSSEVGSARDLLSKEDQSGSINNHGHRPSSTPSYSEEGYVGKLQDDVSRKTSKNLKKSRKDRVLGTKSVSTRSQVKRKRNTRLMNQKGGGRQHRELRGQSSDTGTEDSSNDSNYQATGGDSKTENSPISDTGKTITHPQLRRELSLMRVALLAEVEKSWDEVMKCYLDSSGSEQVRTLPMNNPKAPGKHLSDIRSAVRVHMRDLLFPGLKYPLVPERLPWSTLGMWLCWNKKTFINWDKILPFPTTSSKLACLGAGNLRKLLDVSLADWSTKDKKGDLNAEIPLVVDPKGRVLVKVGDIMPQIGYRPPLDKSGVEVDTDSRSTSAIENTYNQSTSSPSTNNAQSDSEYRESEKEKEAEARPRKVRKLNKLPGHR